MKTNHVIILVLFALCNVFCKKPIDPQLVCMEKWSNNPRAFLPECGGCNRDFVAINDNCYQGVTSNLGVMEMPNCMDKLVFSNHGLTWFIYDYKTGEPLGDIFFAEKLDGNYYSVNRLNISQSCVQDYEYMVFFFSNEEFKRIGSQARNGQGKIIWSKQVTIDEEIVIREEQINVSGIN
jgi:hypothetical protein